MFGFIGDIARIAVAPVVIVTEMARVVTKPVADLAEQVVKEVSDTVKDVTR